METTTIFPGMTVTSVIDTRLFEVLTLNQRTAKHVRALYVRIGWTWISAKLTRSKMANAPSVIRQLKDQKMIGGMGDVAIFANQVQRELKTMAAYGVVVPQQALNATRDLAVMGPCSATMRVGECVDHLIERWREGTVENSMETPHIIGVP